MLISGNEKIEQVRVTHAVHGGNDQLTELKLRIVSGGDFAKEDTTKMKTSEQLGRGRRSAEWMQEGFYRQNFHDYHRCLG